MNRIFYYNVEFQSHDGTAQRAICRRATSFKACINDLDVGRETATRMTNWEVIAWEHSDVTYCNGLRWRRFIEPADSETYIHLGNYLDDNHPLLRTVQWQAVGNAYMYDFTKKCREWLDINTQDGYKLVVVDYQVDRAIYVCFNTVRDALMFKVFWS